MTPPTSDRLAGTAWPLALATVAIGGTLATACMMPFVGLAVIAAATMARGPAAVTVAGVWAANQLLGFGLLGYPLDGYAIGWGLALGAGSLAAMLVARGVLARAAPDRGLAGAVPLVIAFAVAFAAYEALLFAFALVQGGTETFAPSIVVQILANDAAWALVLALVHAVLARTAPRLFAPAPSAA